MKRFRHEEDVRHWAYDAETLNIDDQDEDLMLWKCAFLPTLVACADDDACPKREGILNLLEDYARTVFLHRRMSEIPSFMNAASLATSDSGRQWAAFIWRVHGYLSISPPLKRSTVEQVASELLVGPRLLMRYRSEGLERFLIEVKVHPDIKNVWIASQTFQAYATHLYLDGRTGAWWASVGEPADAARVRAEIAKSRAG